MNICKHQMGLLNLDELEDNDFEAFLEHSGRCRPCEAALIDYQKSMLPVLRAALPEKIVSYIPKVAVKVPTVREKMISEISKILRKTIIEVTLMWRKIFFLRNIKLAYVSSLIIAVFFGGFLVYGFNYFMRSDRDSEYVKPPQISGGVDTLRSGNRETPAKPLEVEPPNDSAAQQDLPSNKKTIVKSAAKPAPKAERQPQVEVLFDTATSNVDKQKQEVADTEKRNSLPESEKENESPAKSNIDQSINNKSPLPNDQLAFTEESIDKSPVDSFTTVPLTVFQRVNFYPDKVNLADSTFTTVRLKVLNISPEDIENSICTVYDSTRANSTSASLKDKSVCEPRVKVGYVYFFEITTPGYKTEVLQVKVKSKETQNYKLMMKSFEETGENIERQ